MPTSTPALARPSPQIQTRRLDVVATLATLIVGAALLAAVNALLVDPDRVDLTVENPTQFDVNIDVRSLEGEGRLGLGTVDPGTSKSLSSVVDQGGRWLFEFSYGGVKAPPVEVSREVVTTGTVVVPEIVGELFLDAGLSPPPR